MNEIVTKTLPTYDVTREMMSRLTKKYRFLKKLPVGKSFLGREIQGVTIGDVKDKVLYVGAVHGSEWITSLLLLKFVEELCQAIDEGREFCETDPSSALHGRGLAIVPCLNPDGVEIALTGPKGALWNAPNVKRILGTDSYIKWQANGRGVDLNHNFDAGWDIVHRMELKAGIIGPAMTRYGGTEPESEPETQAITQLCRDNPFRHALAFHSQGEEIYWYYGDTTPPRARLMAGILAASSRYELAEPEEMASHGGFKDWFIERFHRPAFTIEVGKGENPLPLDDLDSIYSQTCEMILLASLM